MERVNRIIDHPEYRFCLSRIKEYEEERIFCRHDSSHFLDVARIAMLMSQEENLHVEKELIYAAALLHDIGRFLQYEKGLDHAQESARLSVNILKDSGFLPEEITLVTTAIAGHRNIENKEKNDLSGLLYRADKRSRPCFFCQVEKQCDWKSEKKNRELTI